MLKLIESARDESGHAVTLAGALVGAVGMIMLAIGAANGTGWLTIAGGIVGAVGLLAYDVLRHTKLDYGLFDRLEKLEKK
jgi:uncharacterized membrane protein YjfL (UPF0719 family)